MRKKTSLTIVKRGMVLVPIEKAHQKKWVVYCESSLPGAEHVIRYLGQYTHRIAISNQRILNVDSTHGKTVPWVSLPKTSKTDNKSIIASCSPNGM